MYDGFDSTILQAILFCYFQLNREDYRWWWRSFLAAGSTGIYIFFYGIYYYLTQMEALYITTFVLYFCYMSLFSLAFFLVRFVPINNSVGPVVYLV